MTKRVLHEDGKAGRPPATTELEQLRAERDQAIEQQAAVSEVLATISRSAFDLPAVLRKIAERALDLANADTAVILRVEGPDLVVAAEHGPSLLTQASLIGGRIPVSGPTLAARAVRTLSAHYAEDVRLDPSLPQGGTLTRFAVPIQHNGTALGSLVVARVEAVSFTERQRDLIETFADQAAIAIQNVRLFNETKEALERQTALSEVLRSISGSPTDAQPVLDVVAKNAARFCGAEDAGVLILRAGMLVQSAHHGELGWGHDPLAIDPTSVSGRAVLEARTLQVADLQAESLEYPRGSAQAVNGGYRATLASPLLREGQTLGVILLRRKEATPFTDRQVDLVRTFADQAAIAIENVRLFHETKEALEQQTATADILRLIADSPADVQPVLDGIARSAAQFCGAENVTVALLRDGSLHAAAAHGPLPGQRDQIWAATRTSVSGRAVIDGGTLHVVDLLAESDDEYPTGKALARELGTRTVLATPLLREGSAIGALLLRRTEVRAFTPQQVELVETFAAQAVIAIENVRLFNETKEALEQQTAISDVLGAISGSVFDLDAVLRTIAERSIALCRADTCAVYRVVDDDRMRLVARAGPPIGSLFRVGDVIDRDHSMLAAVATRTLRTHQVEDAEQHPELPKSLQRARLAVPIIRDGAAIGSLLLGRFEPSAFAEREVQLVHTFAQQAGIAIENVRLFNETKEALERQTAVSEILRVIAGSPTDVQPVLDAIAESAARFCGAENVSVVLQWDDGLLYPSAHVGALNAAVQPFPLTRETVTGRSMLEGRPVHVHDLQAESDDYPLGSTQARAMGHRTTLATPLTQGGRTIGAILMRRAEVSPFTEHQIELVQTFADQAVIAIENVRLFNETKEALERQTAISDILRVISASPTDVQPVLDAIADSAMRFCAAQHAIVNLSDGSMILPVAGHFTVTQPFALDRSTVTGRSLVDGRTYALRDLTDPAQAAEFPLGHAQALTSGERAIVATPMMRERHAIGGIVLWRTEPRAFTDREIELVETFAAQAVIAIENVRLFNETKEALEQQTAVSDVLATISRSAFDLDAVLQTIAGRAADLANADTALIHRLEGQDLVVVGRHGAERGTGLPQLGSRIPAAGPTLAARAIRTLTSHYAEDVRQDPSLPQRGTLTRFAVPIQRDGQALGSIVVAHVDAVPFTERQRAIVATFADQAAIAIENVRLFNETKEALEQQTATSEVLQTISRSAFDLQAVLDTVVERAAQLCDAQQAWMRRIEGDMFRLSAYYGASAELVALFHDMNAQGDYVAIDYSGMGGRAVLERRPIHVPDVAADPDLRQASLIIRGGGRTGLAIPMLRDGEPIGAIVVARDRVKPFSEREIHLLETFADQAVIAIENVRLFEEIQEKGRLLEAANRHKSEFLANMSHELRTPLNAIIGFSEVLLQGMFGELNPKQREYQQDVLSSGRLLLSLINDILDLAKVEAGKVELELSEFSLPEALDHGVTMVRERAARHGIRIDVHVDGVDGIVADERKVKQIILNLLTNAVKFTRDGGQVSIRAARVDGEIRVAVRDTGIGIDEADKERIFQEFQQASRDPERSREGTGLGLTLTKRFVELHGGRIWVESEPGKGSTFTFTIPLPDAGGR